jgi:glycosyltransferase involved in cell wall biosynthesis
MIVVDDCSSDESVSIVEGFVLGDDRIRLIQLSSNSGAAVARNAAIEAAQGRYIAFLDSDDLWLPQTSMDKLEAWQNLKFDRMFVGDDWKGTDPWNRIEETFADYPVEIVYLPYTLHTSSTQLKQVLDMLHGGGIGNGGG